MDEQSTLKSCISDDVEIPKSYRRYLNYKVKKQKGDKILVKTPQGLKVIFEISDGTLKKIKQQRSIVDTCDTEKSNQQMSHLQKSKEEFTESQNLSVRITLAEEKMEQLEISVADVVSLLEKALPVLPDRSNAKGSYERVEKLEKNILAIKSNLASLDKKTQISHENVKGLRELAKQIRGLEKKILGLESELAGAEKQARIARKDSKGEQDITAQIFRLEQKIDTLENGLAAVEKPDPARSDPLIWQNLSEQLHKLEEKVDNIESGLATIKKPMQVVQVKKKAVEEIAQKMICLDEKMLTLEVKVSEAFLEIKGQLQDTKIGKEKFVKRSKASVLNAPSINTSDKQVAKSLPMSLLYSLLFLCRSIGYFFKWTIKKGLPTIMRGIRKAISFLIPRWKAVLPIMVAIILVIAVLYGSKYYKPRRSLSRQLVNSSELEKDQSVKADKINKNKALDNSNIDTYQQRDYQNYRNYNESQDDEDNYLREEQKKQRISQISKWVRVLKNEEKSNQERREAIGELTKLEARQAGSTLIKLLDNPDLKWKAMIALGKIHYQPAAAKLAKIAQQAQESNDIREEAIIALGNIRSRNAINALRKIMNDKEAESHLRANAAAALGKIGKTATFRELLNALNDKDPLVQAEAANALANVDYPPANKKIIALLLTAADLDVRRAAADALGQNTDSHTRAEARAQALLQVWEKASEDHRLREKAKQSLENLMPCLNPKLSIRVRESLGNR